MERVEEAEAEDDAILRVVIITGPGNCGTSAVAAALEAFWGDRCVIPAGVEGRNEDGRKRYHQGYFEHPVLMQTNERLSPWCRPNVAIPALQMGHVQFILGLAQQLMNPCRSRDVRVLVLKDPRFVFLFQFWLQYLFIAATEVDRKPLPMLICCERTDHAAQARSMARDGKIKDEANALKLIAFYSEHMRNHTRRLVPESDRLDVNFESLIGEGGPQALWDRFCALWPEQAVCSGPNPPGGVVEYRGRKPAESSTDNTK